MSEFLDDTDVPAEFLCPITQQVMVYPFTTSAGNSYEFEAISQWLQRRNVDPLTNAPLSDTSIFPNNSLRSSIQAWLELNPVQAGEIRSRRVVKPPPPPPRSAAGNSDTSRRSDAALDCVIHVHKSFEVGEDGSASAAPSPGTKKPHVRLLQKCRGKSVTAFGHTYTWDLDSNRIRCDGGPWVEAPEPDVFPTPQGLVFFDRTETLDARVLPGTDLAEACRFGNSCSKADCVYAHPFVCRYGAACRHIAAPPRKGGRAVAGAGGDGRCKFFHPSPSSVVPRGKEYPLTQECKYSTACSNPTCHFAHPQGRATVQRLPTRVLVTHSATLEELESPVQIPFELDAACTAVQVQGEFLFTFEPYPGTWAKEHFRRVVLHKFDASACRYRKVTTYELDRHYCNCAVASGRYLVISFWPYEDETMRTVWECMRIGRTMEKALATNSSEIKSLRGEVEELKRQLRGKEQELQQAQGEASALRQQTQQLKRSVQQAQRVIASKSAALSQGGFYVYNLHDDQKRDLRGGPVDQLSRARSKTAQARSDARTQRLKVEALRRQSNRMQKSYESQRMERRRLADPIHIYALNSGRDGFNREDWTLVLDYHKGAHELSLSAPPGGGSTAQMLEVLEHSTVVQFELCVPRDVASIGVPLPLQPGRLCDQF